MLNKIESIVNFLQSKTPFTPKMGIILGTGLGGLIKKIDVKFRLSYTEIPNFPVSTVEGHHGKLIFGYLSDVPVVAMQGRFHYYEGYDMENVTLPVRVMKLLGIEYLFISNASGGVNPDYKVGDLMVLNDHINLIPNPLVGINHDNLGPRFPDMSDAYDRTMIEIALKIGLDRGYRVYEGVYVAVTGPCLETPAEYKYLRIIGADTVGMSTVPEVIVARHMGIQCFAISVITDLGVPGKIQKVSHEEIQKVAEVAEPKLTVILEEMIKKIF
ncbi:MAG: purine-nucleoside phosphorylase [Flavobacteriales bacterium]|nr:purine-nucleoside phosphorylase [Flavobacteriales bacterium]